MNRRLIFIAGGLLLAAIAFSGLTSVVASRLAHGQQEHVFAQFKRHELFRQGVEQDSMPSLKERGNGPIPPVPPVPPLEARPGAPPIPFGQDGMRGGWSERGPFKPFGLPLVLRALANVAVLFGLGLILRTLAPQRLSTMIAALEAPPSALLRHWLTGLATVLATGALVVLAVISVFGLPLVPVLIFGVAIATLSGIATLAAALGQRIRARNDAHTADPNADLLLGLLVFALLAVIPGLNALAFITLTLLGLGLVVATRGGTTTGLPAETSDL